MGYGKILKAIFDFLITSSRDRISRFFFFSFFLISSSEYLILARAPIMVGFRGSTVICYPEIVDNWPKIFVYTLRRGYTTIY